MCRLQRTKQMQYKSCISTSQTWWSTTIEVLLYFLPWTLEVVTSNYQFMLMTSQRQCFVREQGLAYLNFENAIWTLKSSIIISETD